MIQTIENISDYLEVNAAEASRTKLTKILRERKAVLKGHFALHRTRHAVNALRFRGIGQDPAALTAVAEMLFEEMPAALNDAFTKAKVLSPETSGFFLGEEIARSRGLELAIAQTDLRRLPTSSLLVGGIQAGDRIMIVNDIAGSGASTEALRSLIAERHATLQGIVVFGVVDDSAFRRYCTELRVAGHWLVTATWKTYMPDDECPGCRAATALVPISEFV